MDDSAPSTAAAWGGGANDAPDSPLMRDRQHQLFPVLEPAQVAAARRFGAEPRCYAPGEVIFAAGQQGAPAFLVLGGSVRVARRDGLGHEGAITEHGPGQVTGEVSQLSGRPALAEGRAGERGCEAVAFDAEALRALIVGTADVGEILMRAFILRRTALIEDGGGGPVLVGPAGSPDLVRLRGFLTRNGHPHTVFDPDTEGGAAALLDRFCLWPQDLPVVVCPDGELLRNPAEAEIARCLGILREPALDRIYDVAVVGAGPAGLATAVYAASEGLSVLVLDARAFGGQAGASARIENYLGFPTGISGQALAGRAFVQAQKFGAEMAIPVEVRRLDCARVPTAACKGPGPLALAFADGRGVRARAVVVASGARYRRPPIENLADFEGRGVWYWASPVEAKLCAGEEVVLVGGGNSAGQAAVYLAGHARHVRVLVRGKGLAESMSRYLIDRIDALPNVELVPETEVVELAGTRAGGLERVRICHRGTGEREGVATRHLFLFIGAEPATGWLDDCGVTLDGKGFVKTGADLKAEDLAVPGRPGDARPPLPLESSHPGVFAVGDARSSSVKRVGGAIGEGAAVVAQIHDFLAA